MPAIVAMTGTAAAPAIGVMPAIAATPVVGLGERVIGFDDIAHARDWTSRDGVCGGSRTEGERAHHQHGECKEQLSHDLSPVSLGNAMLHLHGRMGQGSPAAHERRA